MNQANFSLVVLDFLDFLVLKIEFPIQEIWLQIRPGVGSSELEVAFFSTGYKFAVLAFSVSLVPIEVSAELISDV